MESNDNDIVQGRLAYVELTQKHQGVALLELSDEMKLVRNAIAAHAKALDRVERKQRAESATLDDHANRLKALETR